MAEKTKWIIDPGHSEVQFKIKHLGITNVNGKFNTFQGEALCTNEDFSNTEIHAVIQAGSIDTNNAQRDTHLKSPDFFDAEKFPIIKFDGRLRKDDDDYVLAGELTIRETKKSVELKAEFSGTETGRFGDKRAGFEVTGKINRKDFGLTWNILAEGGGFVVGEDIKLHFDIQLVKS
jgi:polyisoprenoid-binding protein YceI